MPVDIDVALVRRLLAVQFPRWAGLPVERFASQGTVNAIFRLGDDLAVRMPLQEEDVAAEARLLAGLAPVPVEIPVPLAVGEPAEGYPWAWSVQRWLPGAPIGLDSSVDREQLADDLAAFITALRRTDIAGAPRAYRGGPLAELDEGVRKAIADLEGVIDADAATAVWETALAAPSYTGPGVWAHADLQPGNLLAEDGRLSAVIDFGTAGIADTASDMTVAWSLLTGPARDRFRRALGADDATWTRSRGLALAIALPELSYYRGGRNDWMATIAEHVIGQTLAP
ncbi:aminoglycoside phosphotransferase family protein [Streptomyces sp. A7024]|uniref:Aminoglycoside phosphotransferase family protein n=1 Tax=Streptomyces coryli TaxID=1128680 RepID=A0A6G4U1W2_9ACTN|nr:aminoglycoside phosphotransferase family protein [Streptomyces coryli]